MAVSRLLQSTANVIIYLLIFFQIVKSKLCVNSGTSFEQAFVNCVLLLMICINIALFRVTAAKEREHARYFTHIE